MGYTIAQKIIKNHLVCGEMTVGSDIGLKIDQTLTQDATGTMAYIEYEAMGIPRVKTEKSVAYIDHNTLQTGFENADDHRFIQSVCKKHGIYFSRPGNGICHQVHLERFGKPGKTLIGSDSHTPTGGGIGMLAIGAGGLDVAVAMGGGAYYITMPKMVRVNLTGKLSPWVSAKDIILAVLRVMSVKGGVGKIVEYGGEGVATLTVPERATITNMGAELGATTSVFPSDETTRKFLKAQGREEDYTELKADDDAVYDEVIEINLSELEPLAACPHSPDNVKPIKELEGKKIDQVCIGSCTNSSYLDLMRVAHILKGKKVADNVSLAIAPGSKQVFNMLALNGALGDMIAAGARILESACGPCIGMGQSPNSKGISLRTFNRNFEGRSGTKDGQIYLVSPEMAAISAITGVLTDPRTIGDMPEFKLPEEFDINDNMIVKPVDEKDMFTQLALVNKTAVNKLEEFESLISQRPELLQKCIIFVQTMEYGAKLQEILVRYSDKYHTYYADDEKINLENFAAGKIDCLLTCKKVSEGIDISSVTNIILFSSDRSRLVTTQRIGRALRLDKNNPEKKATVVDFVIEDSEENDNNADADRAEWLTELSQTRRCEHEK